MEFHINRDIFLKALNKVQGIIEKRHTIPILANVLIEAKNNEIIVTATDLEVGVKSSYKSDVVAEGKVTISGKKLYEIIKEFPDKNIKFISKNNYWVEITCGKSIFNLVGLSPDEFPKFPDLNLFSNEINQDLFIEMIDKTYFSISNDETKFNLTGIFIKEENLDNNNNLIFVSTDGHRLSLVRRPIQNNLVDKFKEGFILPKKGILEVKKIIDAQDGLLQIDVHENNFTIKTNNTTLIMRLIDGNFPDYERVIPEIKEKAAIINRENFLHALKRISIISSEKSKGIKFNLNNNLLILSTSNPDLGDAKEEIEIKYDGQEMSIGFNAKYVLDILQSTNSENILLFLKDNISPGLIKPENDENYLTVVMPMRL